MMVRGTLVRMDEFVSEPMAPRRGTFSAAGMARGEPGLPSRFTWRGREYAIVSVLRAWKSSTREGGVGELYLRRHWYQIQCDDGQRLTIYCERKPKPGRTAKHRWWVYSVAREQAGSA
jgi:hypothetical protein